MCRFVRCSYGIVRAVGLVALLMLGLAPPCLSAGTFPSPSQDRLRQILSDFESYASQGMKDWKVPGMAVAIVQGDRIIFSKGFGVKEVGKADPVDVKTVFQVGSTTKAFTAALVSMTIDDGKLHWQDNVVDTLPEFMMFDPWVTRQFEVVDLMAQRSGLPSYAGDDQSALGFDRPHIVNSLRYMKPTTSFRSAYAYQNGLFLVAAGLVERCTGKSWESNLHDRIFRPLGMSDSSAGLKPFRDASDRAAPHHKVDGAVVEIPVDQRAFNWNYIYGPAGGINSTVMDMARWVRLQLRDGKFEGKQLISEGNVQFMHEPKIFVSPQLGSYCLGWIRTDYRPYPMIWHNGGTPGIKALVQIIPEADLGIVVLSNLGNTLLPESLGRRLADLYFGNPYQDWSRIELDKSKAAEKAAVDALIPPTSPDPPLPLDRYAGTYTSPVWGDVVVSVDGTNLVMIAGPNRLRLVLHPWSRDRFMVNEKDIEFTSFVQFNFSNGKTPSSMTVTDFDEAGEGTLTRR